MNRGSKAALAGLGLLAAALGAALFPVQSRAEDAQVTLRLVDPENPAMLIVNDSDVEAKEIRYEIGLWNADNLREGYKVLPIPGNELVKLPPRSRYGPIKLFNEPGVRAWLKPGNRVVGNIAVRCENCARGHTYWVLITWSEGGWFANLASVTHGKLIAPMDDWDTNIVRDFTLKITLLGWTSEIDRRDRNLIAPLKP